MALKAWSYFSESELLSDLAESVWLCIPASTQFQEASVKTMKNLCLAILALSLLATPALAQRGRSNAGGATRGIIRSDKVQAENKKTDKDTDPTKGSKAKKTAHARAGRKNAKHKARGTTSRDSRREARSKTSGGAARSAGGSPVLFSGIP